MLNENTASVLLSKMFIDHVRRFTVEEEQESQSTINYKFALVSDAYNLLGVHDFKYMKDKLTNYTEERTDYYNLSSFFDVKAPNRRKKNELIKLGSFYAHPILQEGPRPSRVVMDYKTMEMKREKREDFFLEIIPSFTIEDLIQYYYYQHMIDPLVNSSHFTQMKNLTESYSLDFILYLIDASSYAKQEDGDKRYATTPAYLNDFTEEALELMQYRVNVLKEGGLVSIVPRKEYFTV